MGNYKFRFSDMLPNAWFYKLKDMGKSRKHCVSHSMKKKSFSSTTDSQKSLSSHPRYSYYLTTPADNRFYNSPRNMKFPDSPRKSSKKRPKRKTIYKPSSPRLTKFNSVHSPRYSLDSSSDPDSLLSDSENDDFVASDSVHQISSWSSTCNCQVTSSTTDIIIDMSNEKSTVKKLDGFDSISRLKLPPILTKPTKINHRNRATSKLEEVKANGSISVKIVENEGFTTQKNKTPTRKSFSSSTGVRLRSNSPKIAGKKFQGNARKSLSSNNTSLRSKNRSLVGSFAVVKSSVDPQRDFKDSMVEMILENNIRKSKDLEELLACYLSLNCNEYHHLIVKAFEQIWFDLSHKRL